METQSRNLQQTCKHSHIVWAFIVQLLILTPRKLFQRNNRNNTYTFRYKLQIPWKFIWSINKHELLVIQLLEVK